MDDIKAIRDALAALWPASRAWQADSLSVWKSDGDELADCDTPETAAFIAACHPERIARLLDALELAQKDAERLEFLMMEVSGAEFRRIGVEYSGGCKRSAIDAAMAASAPAPLPADRAEP